MEYLCKNEKQCCTETQYKLIYLHLSLHISSRIHSVSSSFHVIPSCNTSTTICLGCGPPPRIPVTTSYICFPGNPYKTLNHKPWNPGILGGATGPNVCQSYGPASPSILVSSSGPPISISRSASGGPPRRIRSSFQECGVFRTMGGVMKNYPWEDQQNCKSMVRLSLIFTKTQGLVYSFSSQKRWFSGKWRPI